MDYFPNDCLHDVDPPIPMLHASETSSCLDLPIYDEYDDEHVELPSCDAMLHRISYENSIGHFMFDNPLNLSYAMSEISHIASFQSQHSNYACPIKINPICTYGIDDEMMVIGFCFSCDDIAMLPLHDLRNSSTMPCHDHIVPNMLCFGCCQYFPCDVSTNAHEETPIVSSYILGDLDAFHTLRDSHNCLHHMHSMNNNALDISHDALHNLSLHYAIHNNKPLMMDDMFLYHASHLFEH